MRRAILAALPFFFLSWGAEAAGAFAPEGVTVSIAATVTTARAQVQASGASPHMRVYNSGTVPVFVACGDVTILAVTTTSMPVAGGGVEVIACGQQYLAAVTSTTATVYVTPGRLQ